MKATTTLLCFVSTCAVWTNSMFAQIPNSGFENWAGGNPVGWSTSNDTSLSVNITPTSSSHSGALAVHGAVTTFGGGFPWPPTLISGETGDGFPVSSQHPAVRGWYRLSPLSNDELWITVGMSHADTGVGAGAAIISGQQATYREFVVNIFYAFPQVPDTCVISLALLGPGAGLPHVGSTFHLDDLVFGPASSVDERGHVLPSAFELRQNFPNPFNPVTKIQYALPQAAHVELKVFNPLGEEVAVLVNDYQDAGSYRAVFNGENLPSGMYFYRLQAGEFSQTKKLLLIK